jgi:hypothetical protein
MPIFNVQFIQDSCLFQFRQVSQYIIILTLSVLHGLPHIGQSNTANLASSKAFFSNSFTFLSSSSYRNQWWIEKKVVQVDNSINHNKINHSSGSHQNFMYPIQHYVIKFVSDLRQVSGFLWVLQFPPSIKLTVTM